MHIQESDAITFGEGLSHNIQQLPANFAQAPDRDMARNKRIRHARQPPLLQINIRPANLA
jgi:hypothetical protein